MSTLHQTFCLLWMYSGSCCDCLCFIGVYVDCILSFGINFLLRFSKNYIRIGLYKSCFFFSVTLHKQFDCINVVVYYILVSIKCLAFVSLSFDVCFFPCTQSTFICTSYSYFPFFMLICIYMVKLANLFHLLTC